MMDLALSAFFGLLAPPLISFLKSAAWPTWAKTLMALAVCVVFGALSAYMNDPRGFTTPEQLVASIAVVFTVATTLYKLYFENTPANEYLTKQLHAPVEAPPAGGLDNEPK